MSRYDFNKIIIVFTKLHVFMSYVNIGFEFYIDKIFGGIVTSCWTNA